MVLMGMTADGEVRQTLLYRPFLSWHPQMIDGMRIKFVEKDDSFTGKELRLRTEDVDDILEWRM